MSISSSRVTSHLTSLPKWVYSLQAIIGQDPGNRGIKNLLPQAPQHFFGAINTLYNAKSITCITGFNIPPPETDGPLGSAAIVKYLVQKLRKDVYMVVDDGCEAVQRAAVETALQQQKNCNSGCDNLVNQVDVNHNDCSNLLHWSIFKVGDEEQNLQETQFLLQHSDCLLSIEHLGLAKDGKKYSMRGFDKSSLNASTHHIFLKRDEKIHTAIAVGDGGNEMGFGLVRDAVVQNVPLGDIIGDTISTDFLLPCGVSNWAGHGLTAGLILLQLSALDQKELRQRVLGGGQEGEGSDSNCSEEALSKRLLDFLHSEAGLMTEAQELAMLDAILAQGSVDGITGRCERSIDNMPYDGVHSKILQDITAVCIDSIREMLNASVDVDDSHQSTHVDS